MNFIEAYKALVKGKKVRQLDWDKGEYIKQDKSCGNEECSVCNSSFSEEDGADYELCGLDYLANDWELYEKECKLHTFEEAIVAFKDRKTIKRKATQTHYNTDRWPPEMAILSTQDLMANDWIIIDDEETK